MRSHLEDRRRQREERHRKAEDRQPHPADPDPISRVSEYQSEDDDPHPGRSDRAEAEPAEKEAALGQWRRWRFALRRRLTLRRVKLRPRWVLAGAAAVLVVLWLSPMFVAHSPIFTSIVNRLAADLNGTVTVQSASLGWFSPIVLGGVTVRDREDRQVVEVPSVRGDRALMAVLWNKAQLGKFRLEQPKFTLVLRDNGSNFEDLLANYLSAKEPANRADAALEIVDGSITVQDARGQRSWEVEKFQLALKAPAKRSRPITLEASGTVADKQKSGEFRVTATVQQERRAAAKAGELPEGSVESAEDEEQAGPDELNLALAGLPLAMFEPLARRWVPGAKTSGWISAALQCRWDSHQPEGAMVFQGKIAGEKLRWSCNALGKDQPALERLQASGHVVWQAGQLRLDRVVADSDLGDLKVTGLVDLGQPSGGNRLAAMLRQSCQIEGKLDLAKLAAALPGTLRIQQGAQITSGKVQLSLSSQRGQEGMVWQGKLDATNLTAQRGDRQLTWQQPIQVTLSAREGRQGPVIQQFQCKSDFLTIHAAGSRDQFSASANFNLNKLAEQSGGFIDLGGVRMAGNGWAKLEWRRTEQQTFDANLGFRADGFQLAVPDRLTWKEDFVVGNLTATGQTDFVSQSRLATAVLKLEIGPDTFDVRLMRPVADFHRGRTWPLEFHGNGQIARWQPRLSPWVDLSQWKLAGSYEVLSEISASSGSIGLRGARLTLTDLVMTGPQANLRDRQLQLILAGQWNGAGRRLEIETAQLTGSGLSAQATRFVLAMPSRGALELSGSVQGEIGLDRLQQCMTVGTPDPAAWRLQGKLSGKTDFQQLGGIITTRFEAAVTNLLAAHPSGQRYQEAQILASGRASYNDLNRWLQIEQLTLSSSTINSTAAGRITAAEGQTDLQLSGNVNYDLERVSQLLRARYGEGISLRGRGLAPVSYQGPLGSDKAAAKASLNWESAELYGFQIGPGELRAAFSRGVVDVEPLALDVNGGRLKLVPRVNVSPAPMLLSFQPGRAVEQVSITPTMCASLLQYIAPILAGIAQAQGSFSIDMEGCQIPLANLAQAEIAGRLLIHSIQISPGPLLQELATVLGRATPAQIARDSAIPFRMTGGRIYHQNLELTFSDVKLRTYGSVGLDQTLALMVVVPTPPSWLANPALAPALKNQKTIEVPVGGTLRQPKIDRVALEQISRQFLQNAVQNAARSAVETQINRGLNRLISPPPAPKPKR